MHLLKVRFFLSTSFFKKKTTILCFFFYQIINEINNSIFLLLAYCPARFHDIGSFTHTTCLFKLYKKYIFLKTSGYNPKKKPINLHTYTGSIEKVNV